jgi:hypothetical protein
VTRCRTNWERCCAFTAAEVLYSDEFAKDPTFITKEDLVAKADVVIVGVPHSAYKSLALPTGSTSLTCGACSVGLWPLGRARAREGHCFAEHADPASPAL